MMKIDLTKIEGYDAMTPEEKIAALEAFQYDDHESEVQRLRAALTKSNSDAADWKRKHNALAHLGGRTQTAGTRRGA